VTTDTDNADYFIDYGTHPKDGDEPHEDYARWILLHFRQSAALQRTFFKFLDGKRLFCLYKGDCFRVTGASRLGDIWITDNYSQETGYKHRVLPSELSGWSPEPPREGKS
jgi:hypothetical protein